MRFRFSVCFFKFFQNKSIKSQRKNVFTFKNFNTAGYENKVPAGGPMYIANLYTKEQQSSNVKIYFENGVIFPVFRKGDDVTKFVKKKCIMYVQHIIGGY